MPDTYTDTVLELAGEAVVQRGCAASSTKFAAINSTLRASHPFGVCSPQEDHLLPPSELRACCD